jgi:hypothetical protein
MRLAGHIACIGVKRYWVLVGFTAGTRALRRPTYRWEDNIKVGVKETGLWREGGSLAGFIWLRQVKV